jgi:50S ribosomal protein L16 3-hydroxylase
VEKHLPELAWIVDRFRFIPEWRIDDLMISYAPLGGSVGPHMDLYDVFILQGDGHRRWQLNSQPVAQDNQVADTPLRIQKDFIPEYEWLLEPGDIIYIPPGVSHYGVATDDCMSYSIGFQAASFNHLISDYIAYLTDKLDASQVYRDSDLKTQRYSNEITEDAITRVEEIFQQYIKPDRAEIRRWFGRYVSDTRTDIRTDPEQKVSNFDELLSLVRKDGLVFFRNPASRFAFITENDHALLYIDGEEEKAGIKFAHLLCHNRKLDIEKLSDPNFLPDRKILVSLYNRGKIILTHDHTESF